MTNREFSKKMITAEDIQLLVKSGEGYNVEFKVSIPSKVRELTEEVCAFANAAGGVVLIGIDDQNNLCGANLDNSKKSAIQHSISEITPSLHCSINQIETNGKNIIAIEVPSGDKKPYVFSGAIYVRIGPNSQKLTNAEQMRDFFQQSDKIYFDEGTCKEFNPETEIDSELLGEFKSLAHLNADVSDHQVLSNLRLYSGDNCFKNGAVLFFGKEPEKYFEKAIVRCVAFKGLDKRFIIDDKSFGGPLLFQFRKALQWIYGKLNVRYDIEGQGSGPRKEIWEIPETVLKEAIINSLSHRDYYDKGATTTIELFDDRIEIVNPGGLVSAIPPSEFGKRSHSRNPLVFGLFARMHLVEQIGSGIIRIKDITRESNLPEPRFNTEGMFSIVFYRPTQLAESDKKEGTMGNSVEEVIVELVKANPRIRLKELISKTQYTRRKVEYHISKLNRSGTMERVGVGTNGFWKLNIHTSGDNKGIEKEIEIIEQLILDGIRKNPKVTIDQLAEVTATTRKTIEIQINRMKNKKMVERSGSTRSGFWKIPDDKK